MCMPSDACRGVSKAFTHSTLSAVKAMWLVADDDPTTTSISSLKTSWGASAPKLGLLAVQWSGSNLCKVGSYVAIGVIQSKVATCA